MELWAKKEVECYKESLMGYSIRSLEDSYVESNVEGVVQKALEGTNISKWAKGHSCMIFWQRNRLFIGKIRWLWGRPLSAKLPTCGIKMP